jgi:hypothetical protein
MILNILFIVRNFIKLQVDTIYFFKSNNLKGMLLMCELSYMWIKSWITTSIGIIIVNIIANISMDKLEIHLLQTWLIYS